MGNVSREGDQNNIIQSALTYGDATSGKVKGRPHRQSDQSRHGVIDLVDAERYQAQEEYDHPYIDDEFMVLPRKEKRPESNYQGQVDQQENNMFFPDGCRPPACFQNRSPLQVNSR
jgi:hypothetical protein